MSSKQSEVARCRLWLQLCGRKQCTCKRPCNIFTHRYGQTNCFVGPTLTYGLYEASDSEVFLITDRAARNMAYQGCFDRPKGIYEKVIDIKGADVIGTKVKPAFGVVEAVYVLPMDGVLATKVSNFQ